MLFLFTRLDSCVVFALVLLSHVFNPCLVVSEARLTLISEGLYGCPDDPLQTNLNRVFRDFRAWCKNNKKRSSQRCFTVGMVSRHCTCGKFYLTFISNTVNIQIMFLCSNHSLSLGDQAEQQCHAHTQSLQWSNHRCICIWSLEACRWEMLGCARSKPHLRSVVERAD